MSAATDMLKSGQAFLAAQFPATITIGGQSYTCASGGASVRPQLADGGVVEVKEATFWITKKSFDDAGATVPAGGETLTSGGLTYHIEQVDPAPGGETLVLRCVEAVR